MAPAHFDPGFRAGLIALADRAERNLGLIDAHIAMVCHACRAGPDGAIYEASVASERTPQLVREMRRGFAPQGAGDKRCFVNSLGALMLVDMTLADLDAARAAITPA